MDKDCFKLSNSKDWEGTHLCFDKSFPFKLSWSDLDQHNEDGKTRCLKISEPNDWTWHQRYLCI